MNASSLLPVLALDPQPGQTILDSCAAPGGKALFIHDLLNGSGQVIANDLSSARRQTMRRIFAQHQAEDIEIWGRKAETIFKSHSNHFDKILVDAPCNSEKHVYNSPHHLHQWSPSRIRQLKQRQLAILSGLFLALKPGGVMVYSTCAVTPEENEAIVAKLLHKKQPHITLLPPPTNVPGGPGLPGNYKSVYDLTLVRRILPQNHQGLDPMFMVTFQKGASS
jgi:16S rRNA C967 or C1407 C5-methylase (RsmB/RsmF family)